VEIQLLELVGLVLAPAFRLDLMIFLISIILFFSTMTRPALGPTSLYQMGTGVHSSGVKRPEHEATH
jgi:hypothetical protein